MMITLPMGHRHHDCHITYLEDNSYSSELAPYVLLLVVALVGLLKYGVLSFRAALRTIYKHIPRVFIPETYNSARSYQHVLF